MDSNRRYRQFRDILQGVRCVVPASVFDPISVRAAEDIGYELGMMAGSTASLTVLGAPDLVLLTLTELADQARRVCRASGLPLLVDADHGYGNALNAMRTVQELQAAGVAALTIEDSALPRSYGEAETRLISCDEFIGKLKAALAARGESGPAIAARMNLFAIKSTEEMLARARAYAACAPDALFLAGLRRRDQLDAIASVVHLPLIVGAAVGELSDMDYLASRGVRIANRGHQAIAASIQAIYAALAAQQQGRPVQEAVSLPTKELVQKITRSPEYRSWSSSFLQVDRPETHG